MNNEKNFLLAIIFTILTITFYPLFIRQFFPQLLPAPKENSVKNLSKKDAVEKGINNIEHSKPAETQNSLTYSKEKSYVLENAHYKIIINSPHADIKSIELKRFINPETKSPTVLCDTEDFFEGIFALQGGFSGELRLKEVKEEGKSIAFLYETVSGLRVKKTIRLDEETYSIPLEIEISNLGAGDVSDSIKIVSCAGIKNNLGDMDARLAEFITVLENKKIFKKNINNLKKEEVISGRVKISGFKTRYFTVAIAALMPYDYAYGYKRGEARHEVMAYFGVGINELRIKRGEVVKQAFLLYAGPNDHEQMAALNAGIEEIKGQGIFAGFSDFLLILLRWLYALLKNYGLAVIALALLINLFLYPLTFKSLKSMKEIQLLQPEIEKLKEQTKNDPQKLNKEIMELYKKHKVNPLGGCLPMLFQMPVFFALYQVLMSAVELRGASFLWIKDLATPDAAIVLSQPIFFIGDKINALPLMMVALTFLQQKMTGSGQTNEQQKMMMMMMPVLLGVIFYNFPAGLALYFLVNTGFSFVMQVFFFSNLSLVKE